MVKSVKSVKKRGRNKYSYNKSRISKANKASKKKHVPKEAALAVNWDASKTTKSNLDDIGLVYDLNKVNMEVDKPAKSKKNKSKVVTQLEAEALVEKVKTLRVPNPEVLFAVHMLDRYDEDYEGMARDSKNHYQLTASQIRKKLEQFKRTFQYKVYLKTKAEMSA